MPMEVWIWIKLWTIKMKTKRLRLQKRNFSCSRNALATVRKHSIIRNIFCEMELMIMHTFKDTLYIIREYQTSDCKEITELFYNTVHTVNAKDYTKEQLDAWAKEQVDLEKWNQSLQEHYSIVAVEDEVIVGFGDIDKTGYLDRLFVHTDYQGRGIATAICNQLEQAVKGDITTHASITAKSFFEKKGYRVVKEQQVERQGVFLTNFYMEKIQKPSGQNMQK